MRQPATNFIHCHLVLLSRRPGTRQKVSEPRGVWSCNMTPPTPPVRFVVPCGSCVTVELCTGMGSASSGSGVDSRDMRMERLEL